MNNNKNQSHDLSDKAGMGNASNPDPSSEIQLPEKQLIGKEGEKYLREGANIEDLPDAQDEQEAEHRKEKMNNENV